MSDSYAALHGRDSSHGICFVDHDSNIYVANYYDGNNASLVSYSSNPSNGWSGRMELMCPDSHKEIPLMADYFRSQSWAISIQSQTTHLFTSHVSWNTQSLTTTISHYSVNKPGSVREHEASITHVNDWTLPLTGHYPTAAFCVFEDEEFKKGTVDYPVFILDGLGSASDAIKNNGHTIFWRPPNSKFETINTFNNFARTGHACVVVDNMLYSIGGDGNVGVNYLPLQSGNPWYPYEVWLDVSGPEMTDFVGVRTSVYKRDIIVIAGVIMHSADCFFVIQTDDKTMEKVCVVKSFNESNTMYYPPRMGPLCVLPPKNANDAPTFYQFSDTFVQTMTPNTNPLKTIKTIDGDYSCKHSWFISYTCKEIISFIPYPKRTNGFDFQVSSGSISFNGSFYGYSKDRGAVEIAPGDHISFIFNAYEGYLYFDDHDSEEGVEKEKWTKITSTKAPTSLQIPLAAEFANDAVRNVDKVVKQSHLRNDISNQSEAPSTSSSSSMKPWLLTVIIVLSIFGGTFIIYAIFRCYYNNGDEESDDYNLDECR